MQLPQCYNPLHPLLASQAHLAEEGEDEQGQEEDEEEEEERASGRLESCAAYKGVHAESSAGNTWPCTGMHARGKHMGSAVPQRSPQCQPVQNVYKLSAPIIQ